MLILCYNVAGWQTTHDLIKEQYGSIKNWLELHKVDILCLQEVKLTTKKLAEEPKKCGAQDAGWESAWSMYRLGQADERKRTGTWNGVATFCRSGLLASANADALGDPELDGEGRCLMTDHGAFLLFNVYVPTSSDSAFKYRFLTALRTALDAKRAAGRAVVLAGDLNLSRRAADVPGALRLLDLARALGEDGAEALPGLPEPLRARLRRLGPSVRAVLAAVKVVCTPGSNAGGFARRTDSWRAHWAVPDGSGSAAKLGPPFPTENSARKHWNQLGELWIEEERSGRRLLLRRGDRLAVGLLSDLCCKALGETLSKDEESALGAVAETHTAPYLVEWAEALCGPGGPMADSYAEVRRDYQGRYTCWEQYTNRRYINEGTRIDYILVDRRMLDRVRPGAEMADGQPPPAAAAGDAGGEAAAAPRRHAVQSEEAAAAAATAGGLWVQAPFDGSGLQDAPLSTYATQFEEPGTGIRYMPPKYSDHTAVQLLLEDEEPAAAPLTLVLDSATLKASPHRSNKSITSFFSKAPPGGAAAAGEAGGSGAADKKRKEAPKPAGIKGLWEKKK